MKICLYLEFYHFWGGILFKKIGTGLLSSYRNQKVMLDYLGIPFVEKWDDSCDILQINTPWLKSLYLIKKAKRRGIPVIIWTHVTVEDAMQVFWFMPLVAPLFKKYLIYAYSQADLLLPPSEYTKSLLLAYGLPEEKIKIQSLKQYVKEVWAKFRDFTTEELFEFYHVIIESITLHYDQKKDRHGIPQLSLRWLAAERSPLWPYPTVPGDVAPLPVSGIHSHQKRAGGTRLRPSGLIES